MNASGELFATETMAELCARQGRIADAVAIYRRLLAGGAADERGQRWAMRLEALERMPSRASGTAAGAPATAPSRAPVAESTPAPAPVEAAPASVEPAPAPAEAAPADEGARLALTVEQPVRSGQVIYAQGRDLVVLAPVNPGAELIADGNIHVYGPLRGRAVAGAHGHAAARIFCSRFEAELVGIDVAYLTSERFPPDRFGKPSQVLLRQGRCLILPL